MSLLSHLSFSSLALTEDPFDWAYGLEEIGFTGWEIVSEGRQTLTDETMARVREILETTDLQLSLHLPFSDLNLASLNVHIWEETLRQQIEYMERAAPFIEVAVVHPGHLSPLSIQLPDLAWRKNLEGIERLCQSAADLGVVICVENMVNMKFIFGRDASEIVGMIETIGAENLAIAFDIGHANTNGVIDEFIKFKEKIRHIHAHDNHGERDEHLPIGEGTIDWWHVTREFSWFKGRTVLECRSVGDGKKSMAYLKNIATSD
ncbi:sugar phosphate isomerase/epimerase [Methanosarcinales archaeon]|nr:MAG: sugar phosphate isomerase/epimerase [Methanosarcinales archaeon]RLG27396.1 MAG: sugar phosphate isomerase/epimerase [Methanosarcinales archaeon]HHI30461.1 sugar phosphate isomerase/epimerase [Candidatus Methanoperedenaceae archaeon]